MKAALKLPVLIAVIILGFCYNSYAQKVANYYTGTPGTTNYQQYSFWTKANKATKATYTYGANRNQIKITNAGKTTYHGQAGFKINLPKGVFYVIPSGVNLKIINPATKKTELFKWEYEGPVNGIGTYCDVCAQDEKEAMSILKKYYL